jgi:CBS domain-containing protein
MYGYIRDVLSEKGGAVHTIPVGATVREAVQQMNDSSVGSLVVLQLGQIVGIFTERDVLRRVVDTGLHPGVARVSDVMTAPVVTIDPGTRVTEAMEMMTNNRMRHLPVIDGGELVGMISIGDLLRWVTRAQQDDIESMKEYIIGGASVPPNVNA